MTLYDKILRDTRWIVFKCTALTSVNVIILWHIFMASKSVDTCVDFSSHFFNEKFVPTDEGEKNYLLSPTR